MSAANYNLVLVKSASSTIVRELCTDQNGLAELLANSLRAHPASPPDQPPALSNALQGNLSEYGVWEIGERYWALFQRAMTWTANADSPWKASSSDGVDILAICGEGQDPHLLIVEVKSSNGPGANLVTGGGSSLQSDFQRLFEGPVQNRLPVSVGKVLTSLRFVHRRPELEEQVKGMVGDHPTRCPSVKLLGVLCCNQGVTKDEAARQRAFDRLRAWLVSVGWDASQISCRTIEADSITDLLDDVIDKATS